MKHPAGFSRQLFGNTVLVSTFTTNIFLFYTYTKSGDGKPRKRSISTKHVLSLYEAFNFSHIIGLINDGKTSIIGIALYGNSKPWSYKLDASHKLTPTSTISKTQSSRRHTIHSITPRNLEFIIRSHKIGSLYSWKIMLGTYNQKLIQYIAPADGHMDLPRLVKKFVCGIVTAIFTVRHKSKIHWTNINLIICIFRFRPRNTL